MSRAAVGFFVGMSLLLFAADPAAAQCAPGRPCGPPGLGWAIPQGVAGANFRAACYRHDACYSTPGLSRRQCDRQFLRGMQCACRSSRHPVLCRMTARTMFVVTRLFGGPAFRASRRW